MNDAAVALADRPVLEILGAPRIARGAGGGYARLAVRADDAAGALYVAVESAATDGRDGLLRAVASGARGLVCARGSAPRFDLGVDLFEVDEPVRALRRLAALWRARLGLPVFVVVGSAGKTTTRELLAALLRGVPADVLSTEENLNGWLGIAITLAAVGPHHGAAVVEIGIDAVGAMDEHLAVVRPTHAVVTCIGPEHLDGLGSVEVVAREELRALDGVARAAGTLALNLDDPHVRAWAERPGGGRRLAFSFEGEPSDARLVGRLHADRGVLELCGMGLLGHGLPLPLPGRHNAQNLLAAATLAVSSGLGPRELTAGLATFRPPRGRSEVLRLATGVTLVLDHYNANPTSVCAAFTLLTELGAPPPARWACLGDMLGLGAEEEAQHRDLAGSLVRAEVGHVLLYGRRTAWLADELARRGFAGDVRHHASHGAMADDVLARIRDGDAVLVKGSRGMEMERVVERLVEDRRLAPSGMPAPKGGSAP